MEYGWGNKYIDFVAPMVCFCDIPLSWISEHTKFYGQFGIGVTPQWIKSHNDITPVQYISITSTEFNSINKLLTKLKNGNVIESEIHKLLLAKKVSGSAINKKGKLSNKKFYYEREWRFIPSALRLNELIIPVEKHEQIDLEELSKNTKALCLKLNMTDIRYLIIPDDSYRSNLIKTIREIFQEEPQEKIDILISRIITLKQIKEDF